MRSLPVRIQSVSLLSALLLGGCASVQTGTEQSDVRRFSSVDEAMTALREGNLIDGSGPRVRLYVPGAAFSASRYIDARISVTEDAYVMVVAVDRDRQVHVVFPEAPDASGFVSHEKPVSAQKFFAGFGQRSYGYSYAGFAGFGSQTGNMIAIASDRPLQFERLIDADGQWDEYALERMFSTGNAPMVAHSLGRLLTLTGQTFSNDFTNFINGQYSSSFAYARGSSCAGNFGYNDYSESYRSFQGGFDGTPSAGPTGVIYSVFNGVLYAQYRYVNQCGMPYYSQPIAVGPAKPVPVDTMSIKADSTKSTSIRTNPGEALAKGSGTGGGIPVRMLEEALEPKKSLPGYRVPMTGSSGAGVRDSGTTQRAGGIRFRSAEQVESDPGGYVNRPRSSAWGTNPTRMGEEQRRIRTNQQVGTGSNVSNGEGRPTRMQSESTRPEHVRAAPPIRSEPAAVRPATQGEKGSTQGEKATAKP